MITYAWTLYAPDAADIVLPTLPPDLDDIGPNATDAVTATALMFEADTIPGYDTARNDLDTVFNSDLNTQNLANTVRTSASPRPIVN